MALFETQRPMNRQALENLNFQIAGGGLVDADILALATVAGLKAVAFDGFESARGFDRFWKRFIDYAESIGTLTDAGVAAADTVAGLRALFTTADAGLSATQQFSSVG